MRIPTRKIYRAFHEFDDFSDVQCERFMRRVRISGAKSSTPTLAFIFVTLASFVFSCVVSGLVVGVVEEWFPHRNPSALITFYDLLGFLLAFAPPPLLGLFARDFVLRRNLRSVINEKLERIRCLACKYILIGQIAQDHGVTCPECGLVMRLEQLGIVADDLIPPEMGDPTGHSFV